ncbi:MAG: 3-deoxy-D-manno-octulosonic acid transferase [Paracoccaceae bacterium]
MTHRPRRFPSPKVRVFLLVYRVLWFVMMPAVLVYLWRRGRADALYFQNLPERYGMHRPRSDRPVWVHAVSLGEMRSAVPLVRGLLEDGVPVVTTHFTPAGRREAQRAFGPEIAAGQMRAVWVPFDYPLAFRRFFAALRPRYGLVMEVEFWPGMIAAAHKAGVPLMLCNGQYPQRSYDRDRGKRLSRMDLVTGFAGVMVKNAHQEALFHSLGQTHTAVTGELRFEQPIPPALTDAAQRLRPDLAGARPVIALASVVVGEDALMIDMIRSVQDHARAQGQPVPLFVYVPRAPERFDTVAAMLVDAGLTTLRRSEILDAELAALGAVAQDADVLLGDSLGEMYFYLGLCDRAVVGGGFTPKGSHNIIEPLALHKPVVVGPVIWPIAYPAEDAIAAGVCTQVTKTTLTQTLIAPTAVDPAAIDAFLHAHGTALARTRAAIPRLIAAAGYTES